MYKVEYAALDSKTADEMFVLVNYFTSKSKALDRARERTNVDFRKEKNDYDLYVHVVEYDEREGCLVYAGSDIFSERVGSFVNSFEGRTPLLTSL